MQPKQRRGIINLPPQGYPLRASGEDAAQLSSGSSGSCLGLFSPYVPISWDGVYMLLFLRV